MTRIVIVGNDIHTGDLLAGIATELDAHVHRCADGLCALKVLRDHPDCNLVVTRLQLPSLGGLPLLQAIRQDPALATLPVVVVDTATCASEVNAVMDAGATGFLGMPLSACAARKLLEEHLGSGLTAAV